MFDISLRVESIRDVCQKKTRENVGILKKKTGGEGMRFKISLFKISCSKFLVQNFFVQNFFSYLNGCIGLLERSNAPLEWANTH